MTIFETDRATTGPQPANNIYLADGADEKLGGPPSAPQKGLFIALEGMDGSGKSTGRQLLGAWLSAGGLAVVMTREPGGTGLGQQLRKLLLNGEHICAKTEALLFAADRAHHASALIKPALQRGDTVLTDRYIDSSLAYQGAARQLGQAEIAQLSTWATGALWPDLTILFDIDPQVAAQRRGASPDRIEKEDPEFHRTVRENYLRLAQQRQDKNPASQLILDAGNNAPEQLLQQMQTHLTQYFGQYLPKMS